MSYVAEATREDREVLGKLGFRDHPFLLVQEYDHVLLMAYRTVEEALEAQKKFRL